MGTLKKIQPRGQENQTGKPGRLVRIEPTGTPARGFTLGGTPQESSAPHPQRGTNGLATPAWAREREAAWRAKREEDAARGQNRNGYASMAALNAETNGSTYREPGGGAAGGFRQTAADSQARLGRLYKGLETRASAAERDKDGVLRFQDGTALSDYQDALDRIEAEERRLRGATLGAYTESTPFALQEMVDRGVRGPNISPQEVQHAIDYAKPNRGGGTFGGGFSQAEAQRTADYEALGQEIEEKRAQIRYDSLGDPELDARNAQIQREIADLNEQRRAMERETPELREETNLEKLDRGFQSAVDAVFGFDPFKPLDDWDRDMTQRAATGAKNAEGRNASVGEIIGGAIVTGMADFNKQVASGLDFLLPTDFLGEYDPFSALNELTTENQASLRARQEYALEDRSTAAKIASEVGSGTVAALPQAITALLSLPAAGIQSTAALAPQASGLAGTISSGVKAIAQNPGYWQSFLSTVGGEYEDARAQGGTEWESALSAIVSAMANSVVEVGGGIQTLPGNLQNPGTSALLEWFKSGIDEGKEEVIQSLISGITQKALVDGDKPVFSFSDEDAIVNPLSLLEDFGMGAAVGWTLGGGEALLTGALNSQGRRESAAPEAQPETHGQEAALLEKYADAFGESGRRAMMAAYTPGQNAGDFYAGFAAQYQAGLTGRDGANARSGNLTQAQQYAAYTAGQNDAAASLEAERQAAQFAPVAGKDSGLVYDSFVKEAIKSGRTIADRKGNERVYLTADMARQVNDVAKALGVRVKFVDSVGGGEANADIQGADILIEKDTPNPVQYLAGHEFTHRIQDLAPNEYRDLRNYVGGLEDTGAKIDNLMDLYRRRGRDLSYEQALDEVTANYAGDLFENSKTVERFIQDNYENKGLLQRVRDFLRKIVDKLTGRQKIQATEAEQKLTAALKGATEAVQANEQQNAAVVTRGDMENKARYSLKDIDSEGKELTEAQQEFFKYSEVRLSEDGEYGYFDRYGNVSPLVPVYHTTYDEFTIFNRDALGGNTDINATSPEIAATAHIGFWFNTQNLTGEIGSRAEEVYLNITNPYKADSLESLASEIASVNGTEEETPAEMGKAFVKWLERDGYDGVMIEDEEFGGTSFVALYPEQIKRVTNKDPTSDPDIRYSLKGEEELLDETRELVRRAKKEGWSDEKLRRERMAVVDRVYQQLVEEYGAIKPGEKPARAASVPRRTSENEKVSQTVRTILEAKATPEAAIPSIQELVAKGDFSYETITDEAAIARAEKTITDKNWGKALRDWTQEMNAGRVTKDNTALGWALYNNAANSGNLEIAMDILQQMVKNQRSAAQALQATRILKKLSPEGQLYGVVQSVEGLQKELNKRYGDGKVELKIDEDLAKKLLEADGQEARDVVLQDIYRDIGRQMPSRFLDKWNAWRYLSMLGNPRTHVRNIFGNLFFTPVVAAKDLTATGIEAAVSRVTGGNLARNKGLKGVGKLLKAAWADYANIEEAALGGGKYGDLQNANKYIEEGRKIYPGRNPVSKALEAARKANSRALDKEDVWFSKPHYAFALAQFCAAHKITEAEIRKGNDQVLAAARNYAIKEAQKATYRDANALSQTVSSLGKNRGKFLGTVMEGILPFRKTPANILARGLEYSPLGLIKGLSHDLVQVHKGNMTGAEAIDNISAGLTGTGLMALGAWLAAEGLVRGIGTGDDKERELEKLQGHQDYALELPSGTSITLDWLAPEALPFFVGVNLWEATRGSGQDATLSQILNAVGNVSEPMLEMSFLQSLNDLLESGGKIKSGGLGAAPASLASAATSYLTQAFPTLLGQIERTGESERETTYTGKNAFLTEDMQYLLGKVSGKIPGWDYQQIPYIDAWGRHESSGNFGERAFGNFVNPAYTSEIEETPVEKELLRLYKETGEAAVLPSRAEKYFMADGERRDLTAQEYVRYAEKKGQTALKLVSDLTERDGYKNLEDGVKAECIKDAYTYANQTARHDIDQRAAEDSWVQKAKTGEAQYKLPVSTYILLRNRINDIQSLKNADGETISNSKSLLIMQEVYNWHGLTDAQREFLFESFDVGSKVRSYNLAAVEEALQQMRSQQGKKGA